MKPSTSTPIELPTQVPVSEPTPFPTFATTSGAEFSATTVLVLEGISPSADLTTVLALRMAVKVTLKLNDISDVGEPIITAIESLHESQRTLQTGQKSRVSIDVKLSASSEFNPGNVPASAETDLIKEALLAQDPTAGGSSQSVFVTNFANAYVSIASKEANAPVLTVLSVQVAAATPQPSIQPSQFVGSSSTEGKSSSNGLGNAGTTAAVSVVVIIASISMYYWFCVRQRKAMASMEEDSIYSNKSSVTRRDRISFSASANPNLRASSGRAGGGGGSGRQLPPPQVRTNPKQSVFVGYGDAYKSSGGSFTSESFSGSPSTAKSSGQAGDIFSENIFDEVPAPLPALLSSNKTHSTYLHDAHERL